MICKIVRDNLTHGQPRWRGRILNKCTHAAVFPSEFAAARSFQYETGTLRSS